ncbi:MAG: hypothetical protein ABSA50_09765 [Candidatus Bathyarchaeia archaeon]
MPTISSMYKVDRWVEVISRRRTEPIDSRFLLEYFLFDNMRTYQPAIA